MAETPAPPTQAEHPAQHLIDLALEVAGWSPCQSKRGVVIFHGDQVVSHGHNHKPMGFDCDGSDACKSTCRAEAVHAEQLALLHAGAKARSAQMLHVKSVGGALVASGGPSCVQCSKLALTAGISDVWLYEHNGWHRYGAVEFHRRSLASVVAAPPAPPDPPCSNCGCEERDHRGILTCRCPAPPDPPAQENNMRIGLMHIADGFVIERTTDLTTPICLGLTHGGDPFNRNTPIVRIWLSDSQFASIMAHVARRGETGETFQEALKFLQETGIDDDK